MIRSAANRLVAASLRAGTTAGKNARLVATYRQRFRGSNSSSSRVLSSPLQQQHSSRFFSSVLDAAEESTSNNEQPLRRSFEDLDSLHHVTKRTLLNEGITTMTEIQEKTWHAAVEGTDIIGRSVTGSGKTLAFLIVSKYYVYATGSTYIVCSTLSLTLF